MFLPGLGSYYFIVNKNQVAFLLLRIIENKLLCSTVEHFYRHSVCFFKSLHLRLNYFSCSYCFYWRLHLSIHIINEFALRSCCCRAFALFIWFPQILKFINIKINLAIIIIIMYFIDNSQQEKLNNNIKIYKVSYSENMIFFWV